MIVKKENSFLMAYLEDSSNVKGGYADEVVIPENIDELCAFLKDANAKKMPVTISGGGTGTTGSRIPFGGAVISLERFNRILAIDSDRKSALVQSGVMVDDLKKACDEKKLFYTSHPTENTASVGGTIATNASGARSFKYGATRRYVRTLKMVLANGEILEIRRNRSVLSRKDSRIILPGESAITVPIPTYRMPEIKTSAGYYAKDGMDPIDLFIGQEGTLSVIVEMEIGLVDKPSKILSAFVFFETEEDAWRFACEARDISRSGRSLIDALSIEYFDHNSLRLLRARDRDVPEKFASAIFFEQEVRAGNREEEVLDAWIELILKYSPSLDNTWVAMNEKTAEKFSNLRHAIPESV
ncbi:MAG: FAD-binding oxidoreductase, partial [Candidatus Omnitrophica bacterium]|nr:FAD-binding oxidoreductase [Candidatus Omnitrophota bacterium]